MVATAVSGCGQPSVELSGKIGQKITGSVAAAVPRLSARRFCLRWIRDALPSPIRPPARTPTRRYAHTPVRPHAITPPPAARDVSRADAVLGRTAFLGVYQI